MDTKTARRRTFDVEYVVVTEENLEEVANWCRGELNENEGVRSIKLEDKNAMSARQARAFVGDCVLKSGESFKAFTKKSFDKSFEDTGVTIFDPPIESKHPDAIIQQQIEHARSAESGQFVSKEFAEENPDTTVVEKVPVNRDGKDDLYNVPDSALENAPDGVDPKTLGSETPVEDLRGL